MKRLVLGVAITVMAPAALASSNLDSSIYVAATVMLAMHVDREDLLEREEGELVDDLP